MSDRCAGLLVPLFSCPTSASWGVGEIADLEVLTRWLSSADLSILQVLPVNEMAPGQQSPYSAISAMAIDPIFIRLSGVAEFEALGGEAALSPGDRDALAAVRRAPRIDHETVRRLKYASLRAAFERFNEAEWRRDSARARALRGFLAEQAWWIEDYSLFRAIHAREGERPWREWPEGLQRCDPAAIDRARNELSHEVLFFQYLQWIADCQWKDARATRHGVELFGDLPFMVDADSADVWARQHLFRFDATVGAPPDAFSVDGQDWGTPLYNWDAVSREDYRWLRERARRCADLFDGYRIDHLVGFYRTYARPKNGGPPHFTPLDEPDQLAQGERILNVFRESGGQIVAEDLGTVPDFVRASLARLGVPGSKVFRWERYWNVEGQPFRDPSEYPANSVAASGTHDTEPLIVWWEKASEDERRKVNALPTIQRLAHGADLTKAPYDTVRGVILEALFMSRSDLLILPVQDVFGWRDRVNDPAVTANSNWIYRLPWPGERLDDISEARERKERLREWTKRHGRDPGRH